MDSLRLRLDLFPLIITETPAALDEKDLASHLERFTAVAFERRQPYIHFVDATLMSTPPSARERSMLARWRKDCFDRGIGRYARGYVVAAPSMLVRGAMTAISWLVPHPGAQAWVPDRARAVAWAIARFEEANIPVSPAIAAYRDALAAVQAR